MSILAHPEHPEHDQAPMEAAVVFGASGPDDRVRIPRPLLAGIVSLVCDLVSADVDQEALLGRVASGMADRMVVVDEAGFAMYRLVQTREAGGRQVVESQPGLAADIADEVFTAVQALAHLEECDAAPLTALISLPRERVAVGDARRWLADTLISWGVGGEQLDDAVLVLTEMFTNAVEHAAGEGHSTLAAAMWQGHLRITVADPDPAVPKPRAAGDDDESGRGMAVLRALVLRHGTTRTSAGKVVWVEQRVTPGPVMTAGCAACGCPCGTGPACGCTCCCSYEPAVAAAASIGGVR